MATDRGSRLRIRRGTTSVPTTLQPAATISSPPTTAARSRPTTMAQHPMDGLRSAGLTASSRVGAGRSVDGLPLGAHHVPEAAQIVDPLTGGLSRCRIRCPQIQGPSVVDELSLAIV